MTIGREFSTRILLSLLPLVVALGSCSTYTVKEKFDETTRSYGLIVRWEKFETASDFAAFSIRDEFEKRVQEANNVRVLDYQIINVNFDEGKKKATMNVEISYYRFPSNQVRKLIDKQVWLYGEENGSKGWRLITLLPEFK
jgi:hypothetical protein